MNPKMEICEIYSPKNIDCNLIKIIQILRGNYNASTSILKILSDLNTSSNNKQLCEILEYVTDYTKAMDVVKINQFWKQFPRVFVPKILEDLTISESDSEKMDLLGEGDSSFVFLGKLKTTNPPKLVALKALTTANSLLFIEEATTMCKLKHENILQIFAFSIGLTYSIMTQYMEKGNIKKVVQNNCTPKQLLKYCLDISNGLEYIFQQKYVHRDLDGINIFVNANDICKIGDFGQCKYVGDLGFYIHDPSIDICIPGVNAVDGCKYSYETDIFFFAYLIYTVFHSPLTVENSPNFGEIVENRSFPKNKTLKKCPKEMLILIQQCWNLEPTQRPNIGAIKACITKNLSKIST